MSINSICQSIVNAWINPPQQVLTPIKREPNIATNFLAAVVNPEPMALAMSADIPPPASLPLIQNPQKQDPKLPVVFQEATPVLEGFHAMEAYFSWDGEQIIFQGAEKPGRETPLQVYTWAFEKNGSKTEPPRPLTTSSHNCECTFFSADGKHIVFNTQPQDSESESIDFGGYPYSYDTGKETFLGTFSGQELKTERLTHNNFYEAETSFSPMFQHHPGYSKDGVYLLFTSSRSGSLDLYVRRILDTRGERTEPGADGQGEVPIADEAIQITNTPTLQEGGAFFMPDGRIVYRAWEFDPKNPQKDKWERDRVNFRPMQIYIYDPATQEHRQLTSGNARHWAPFPHPNGDKIVFAKRDFSETDNNFDIYVLHLKDGRQEQITQDPHFDGYPVFHPNGKIILFSRYLSDEHRFQLMQVPYQGE